MAVPKTDLLIRRMLFDRLVREITQHHLVHGQVSRLLALQEADKYYLISLPDYANLCPYTLKEQC